MTLTLDPGAKLTEPEVVTEPVTANGVLPMFTVGVFRTFTPTVGGPF
jgi:hypothetical protein